MGDSLTYFEDVYEFFLSKIKSYDLAELTEDEIKEELDSLIKLALPKCTVFKGKIKLDQDNKSFIIKGKDSLSLEEMEILSLAMLLQYISPLIARDENLKQTLSSKDFSSTSQANHLEKLLILKKSIDADLNYAMNSYTFGNRVYGDWQ